MAFSWQESTVASGTQNITCDLEYLDKSYIHVYLDGQETTAFSWTSDTVIRLDAALTAETVVLLIRKTEREYLYIMFASGAPFIEANVDTQNTQFLHLSQELVEGRSIEGFYGDINMHRYRITNLGDPVDDRDAANKQYVDDGDARLDTRIDAEAAARKAADAALDARTTNLEQTFFDANTNSFPWWTVLTEATDTVTPGMAFTKAKVRTQGVTQTLGYSYNIVDNSIVFAETLPAGTLVDVTIGVDTAVDTSAVSTILELLSGPNGAGYITVGDNPGESLNTAFANLVDKVDAAVTFLSPNMGFSSLKACVDAAQEQGIGYVKVPAGVYQVPETINITGSMQIHGEGIGLVYLIQPTGAEDGVINHVLSSAEDAMGYSGFTIRTQRAYDADNYGLRVDMRPQLSGTEVANRTRYRGCIRDIEVAGSYTRSDGVSFGACIDLVSAGWLDVERVRLSGSSVSGSQYNMQGVGILQRGDGKPVETRIMGLRAYNFEYAYLCPEYTEGVYCTDSLAVNCKYGAVVSPVTEWVIGTLGQTGCYQFNVDQFHGNVSATGVFLSSARYCTVSNCMFILDDHSQGSAVQGVHLRTGYGHKVSNIMGVFYNVDGTTGITRQMLVLNGITDSAASDVFGRTESTTYENITHLVRLVNASLRNTISGATAINADVGISVASGCGSNSAINYRFQNTTTPVDDQAGDFNRQNAACVYLTFTLAAAADSYTFAHTPRTYFSRRPNGVSAELTSPTTLSFPITLHYDYANSTASSVSIIMKPKLAGQQLPATTYGVTINMKD